MSQTRQQYNTNKAGLASTMASSQQAAQKTFTVSADTSPTGAGDFQSIFSSSANTSNMAVKAAAGTARLAALYAAQAAYQAADQANADQLRAGGDTGAI